MAGKGVRSIGAEGRRRCGVGIRIGACEMFER